MEVVERDASRLSLLGPTLAMALMGLASCSLEMEKLPVLDTASAKDHVGEVRQVEGVVRVCVECEKSPGKPLKLLLDKPEEGPEPFAVLIPADVLQELPPSWPALVQGQKLRVHGKIEEFRGRPEITVTCPRCLEIVR